MKVGVIGAGAWGKNHVRTLHEMGALGAVVEMDADLRAAVREAYPDAAVASSLDELKSDGAFDGVEAFVVATPAPTHREVADELFAAGRHVLVEKPMALSAGDAEAIVRASEKAGKTLMVGHLLLFQPAIRFIKDYLDQGKLGKIYTLTQRRSKLGRARKVENVLWSFGVHDVAVLLHLVGEAPAEATAFGHSSVSAGVEDDVHLHMRFENGILANLHNSWLWPRVERELIVVGEKGMLVFDEVNQKVILHRKGIETGTLLNRDEGEETVFEGADQPLRLELEHFIESCETGAAPIADGVNGVDVVRVLEQAG
ncbi:MAG: Gfo/Idh/MocA family oxidoreductase [Verrucomicrobiales bacterium]